jgi:hypothetical protein
MADTTILHGGSPNPAEVVVSADQHTILGDGTARSPLRVNLGVVGGGVGNPVIIAAAVDSMTILGDGTARAPLHTNPDGVPVSVDGNTLGGDGTRAKPLHVVGGAISVVVGAATDGSTIFGDGTVGDPLRAHPGSISVAVDGETILGSGTTADPLRAAPGSGGQAVQPLPLAIHGSAFRPARPDIQITIGSTGVIVPTQSGSVQLFSSVTLPTGVRVARAEVRVTDNVGTPLVAHLGSEDGTVLGISQLSPGDGGSHVLQVDVPTDRAAGTAYFVDVRNPSGNASWVLHGATMS